MGLWRDHGTKIIGYVTAGIGVLATLDATTIGLVSKFLGPYWGGKFALGCLILAGLVTARRGHTNTATAQTAAAIAKLPTLLQP